MKEQLPGLTQLLVDDHVKEVIDEVTCGDRQHLVNVFWSGRSLINQKQKKQNKTQADSFDKSSLQLIKCVRGGPCFHDDSDGNQDASWRGAIHIHHPHPPSRHQPYPWRQPFQNAGKIMKG